MAVWLKASHYRKKGSHMANSVHLSPKLPQQLAAPQVNAKALPKSPTMSALQPDRYASRFERTAGGMSPAALLGGGGAVSSGLGVAAAVCGGLQIAQGVQEWQQGRTSDGAVDMVAGGLNVLGGGALATGVNAGAAPFLLGTSSVITGGRDLAKGINSGNGDKALVGAAEMAGGGMMIAGGTMMAAGGVAPGADLTIAGAVLAGGAALYDILV